MFLLSELFGSNPQPLPKQKAALKAAFYWSGL